MALEKRTTIKMLEQRIIELEARVASLEKSPVHSPSEPATINKLERFNDVAHPELREESAIKMNEYDKLISLRNATLILPPNLKVNGRHTSENCSAICGFNVSEEMLDSVYED